MSSSAEAIVTLRGVRREYPGGVVALRDIHRHLTTARDRGVDAHG